MKWAIKAIIITVMVFSLTLLSIAFLIKACNEGMRQAIERVE